MTRRLDGRGAILAACGVAFAGQAAFAAGGPANDLCENHQTVTLGGTAFSTIGANTDGPAHGQCQFDGQTYHDIWFDYTPSEDGQLVVSTCNTANYDTDLVVYSGCDCGSLTLLDCNDDGPCSGFTSQVSVAVSAGTCYLIRVGGWNDGNQGTGTVTLSISDPPPPGSGPDVVYTDIGGIGHYGPIGGMHAYALGSFTCNIGNENLLWLNDGTPGLAMSAFRLSDGRLEQIGQGWVKHACCAAAGSGCGLACNGQGGSVLGAGCRDVYSAGWNAIQSNLGMRSGINAFTGQFSGVTGTGVTSIDRRLQIPQAEMQVPGALYFVEGAYVATDDAATPRALNNASYKRVLIDGAFNMSETGSISDYTPAIYAWQDHGLGVNTPDPDVQIVIVDVPKEGRFFLGAKASDNGDGTWRYEYAIYNLNSDRSGGSFSVPVPAAATLSNMGFEYVPYHSGEPYANVPWVMTEGPGSITWSSPETFDQNPNTNALRWGTLYNFYFDADVPPAKAAGEVTLGLFKPHTPSSVTAAAPVPGTPASCPCDFNGDVIVNVDDLLFLLGVWGTPGGDCNGDGLTNVDDLLALLADWGPC